MNQPLQPDPEVDVDVDVGVGVGVVALVPLRVGLSSVDVAWSGALPAGGPAVGTGVAQQDLASMSMSGLMSTMRAMGKKVRDDQAMVALMAAEVSRRSPVEAGKDGLAKQQGYQNPAHLVAEVVGGSVSTGAKFVSVGVATSRRQSLTGEVLPPKHPHVADALSSGSIGVDAASMITSMLDRVASRSDPVLAIECEQVLAKLAGGIPLASLCRAVKEVEARLDPDGIEPREEELRAGRFLHFRTDSHGMTLVTAALDPQTAAPVKAAIEAVVTHTMRQQRKTAGGDDTENTDGDAADQDVPLFEDTRTVPQMQADALGMLALHAVGCGQVSEVPATTMVVRTDLEALTEGVGHGVFDGIDQPVSAGTIRKLAAASGIIPLVLGGDSLPLDMGRAARLFTPAQRIALAERDGGCAMCGLNVAYTQAHHILWWERDTGPTDLDKGVLLCPPCHTRVHHDGWVIRIDEHHRVWFIPPPHVDPAQAPRLGGKARYGLPRTGAA